MHITLNIDRCLCRQKPECNTCSTFWWWKWKQPFETEAAFKESEFINLFFLRINPDFFTHPKRLLTRISRFFAYANKWQEKQKFTKKKKKNTYSKWDDSTKRVAFVFVYFPFANVHKCRQRGEGGGGGQEKVIVSPWIL